MQNNDAKYRVKVYKNDLKICKKLKSDVKDSELFAIFMELYNKYHENFNDVIKLIIMTTKKCIGCIIYRIHKIKSFHIFQTR